MHQTYFVLVEKNKAKTSKQARKQAILILDNEGFIETDQYFSSGYADWMVVGGRYSGTFQNLTLKKKFHEKLDRLYPDFSFSINDIENAQTELNDLWKSIGGQGLCPYTRDTYKQYGYEDDACILTDELLKKLKREYDHAKVFDSINRTEKPLKHLSNEACGNWLVAIDYHY